MADKLTENELLKRLDNEFSDVDLSIHKCATKGVVATIYFYEDKLKENESKLIRIDGKWGSKWMM